jgi:translation initiation factor 2 subunit 1
MILLSELSRRRIRSINKLIRVGKNEVVMVIRVDKDKGYIDLSKRRVGPEDVTKTEDRFNKAKAVHSILRHLSTRLRVPLLSLHRRVGWPLYRKYGHAYDAFQLAVADPDAILRDLDMSPEERADLIHHISQKMTPQPLKIRADIQVTCFTYEGVEAIRSALLAAQGLSSEAIPIRVQLIAAPLYVMQTTTLDKAAGIAALVTAIDAAKAVIESKGGQLLVKMAPSVTTAQEERDLARMMEDMEGGGAGGDDEDEDEDGEGEEDNEEGMGSGDLPASGLMDFDAAALARASAAGSAASASASNAGARSGSNAGAGAGSSGSGSGAGGSGSGSSSSASSAAPTAGGELGYGTRGPPAGGGGKEDDIDGVEAAVAAVDFGKKKKKKAAVQAQEED